MFAARPRILENDQLLIASGLLVLTLFAGALMIALVDRWRKRHMTGSTDAETLTSYRKLYENGELTKQEYDEIRARVANRIRDKQKPKQPAQPTDPTPPESSTELPLDNAN